MFLIILSVIAGTIFGKFLIPTSLLMYSDFIMDIGLSILLLLVGIDIGRQKGIFKQIKNLGKDLIVIPILIGFGSIFGGILAGFLFKMGINEGGAVGAGFGWYSLSAILLSDYSTQLSAIAFLSNVIRELLAIFSIPFIAKYIGNEEAIAPSGATAMDTTLPIIKRYTDGKTSILAFVSGVILSSLVTVVVPIIINI